MRAIVVRHRGGPDVQAIDQVDDPQPGDGQVRLKVAAAGVNFIDVYHRSGVYQVKTPFVPGVEAAGVVEAVGPGVTDLAEGDRVAFGMVSGAYAEAVVVNADRLVPVPDEIDLDTAAAVLLQGMTAHYLALSTFPLKQGDRALVQAAAGGVGLLLTQIAKRQGAVVIGTVSTEEKAALAREAGCDEVIVYTEQDFGRVIAEGGVPCDVVYDGVGKTTFDRSLECLRPRGMMVLYGQSSGPVPAMDPQRLAGQGSLFLTRPTLAHYIATREELLQRAGDLFTWIAAGELSVRIDQTYPLEDAASAHGRLEGRESRGKILLRP